MDDNDYTKTVTCLYIGVQAYKMKLQQLP